MTSRSTKCGLGMRRRNLRTLWRDSIHLRNAAVLNRAQSPIACVYTILSTDRRHRRDITSQRAGAIIVVGHTALKFVLGVARNERDVVLTTIVMAGMAFCWYNRHLPILRVRGLPLAFGSVFFLHLYWIMAQIVYPIGRTLPVVAAYDTQYFVMGMWFPLGIALFHASNLRFLRVAALQKQYTLTNIRRSRGCNGAHSSWLCKIRNMDYSTKIAAFITTGMVFQVRTASLIQLMLANGIVRLSLP